jgi:UDP-N-acetylglucosamine 2-epimerase
MTKAPLIMTDSGAIEEEASVVDKATRVVGETAARPEAIEAVTAGFVGKAPYGILTEAERPFRAREI